VSSQKRAAAGVSILISIINIAATAGVVESNTWRIGFLVFSGLKNMTKPDARNSTLDILNEGVTM